MAFLFIAVEAAHRADSQARFTAEALHREQQQYLFANRIGEFKPAMIVKPNFGVVFGEADLPFMRRVLRRFVDEMELAGDGNGKAFQTAVAGALNFARQPAMEANFSGCFTVFRLARNVQGLWLKQLTRPEIESPRRELEVELDFAKL